MILGWAVCSGLAGVVTAMLDGTLATNPEMRQSTGDDEPGNAGEMSVWKHIEMDLSALGDLYGDVLQLEFEKIAPVKTAMEKVNQSDRICIHYRENGIVKTYAMKGDRSEVFREMAFSRENEGEVLDVPQIESVSKKGKTGSIVDLFDALGLAFVPDYDVSHISGVESMDDLWEYVRFIQETVLQPKFYEKNPCLWDNVARLGLVACGASESELPFHYGECQCFDLIRSGIDAPLRCCVLWRFCPRTLILLGLIGCESVDLSDAPDEVLESLKESCWQTAIRASGIRDLVMEYLEASSLGMRVARGWPGLRKVKWSGDITSREAHEALGYLPESLEELGPALNFTGDPREDGTRLFLDERARRLVTSLDIQGSVPLAPETATALLGGLRRLRRLKTTRDLWRNCQREIPAPVFLDTLERLEICKIGAVGNSPAFDSWVGGFSAVGVLQLEGTRAKEVDPNTFFLAILGDRTPTPLARSVRHLVIVVETWKPLDPTPFKRCEQLKTLELRLDGGYSWPEAAESVRSFIQSVKVLGREVRPVRLKFVGFGKEKAIASVLDALASEGDLASIFGRVDVFFTWDSGREPSRALADALERYQVAGVLGRYEGLQMSPEFNWVLPEDSDEDYE